MMLSFGSSFAQDENPLAIYEHQVGKTWVVEGTWGDGSVFKQETTLEWGLNKAIVIAHSTGFIDSARTVIGDRNHGVRKYNAEKGMIEFWEFDTFGGLTQGTVEVKGRSLYYVYEYQGYTLADVWEYVDDRTYRFRVALYDNGQLGNVFMDTEYRLKE